MWDGGVNRRNTCYDRKHEKNNATQRLQAVVSTKQLAIPFTPTTAKITCETPAPPQIPTFPYSSRLAVSPRRHKAASCACPHDSPFSALRRATHRFSSSLSCQS